MNRFVLFTFFLTLSCLAYIDPASVKPEGEGTQETPYLFNRMENFVWLSQQGDNINSGTVVYCVQTMDIDATKTENWWTFPEIRTQNINGQKRGSWTLNYDGQGFNIENLCFNPTKGTFGPALFSFGLFQLKNINIIKAKNGRDGFCRGILVDQMMGNGYIDNCHISQTSMSVSGALIGELWGGNVEISNCSVDVELKNSPAGLIFNVRNYGTLVIRNTSAKCNISLDSEYYGPDVKTAGFVNQLVAYKNSKTVIEDCYSDVEINCGIKYQSASGFIGELYNNDRFDRVDVDIKRCYSTGTINKTNGWATASFLSLLHNNYTNEETIVVKDCYYNSTSFKKGDKYALPKTEEKMKQQATFEGWDFENVWAIDEGNGFPYLREAEVEKMYQKLFVKYNGTGECTVDNGVVTINGGSDNDTLAITGALGNRCRVKNIVTNHGLKKIKVTGDVEGMQVAGKVGALLVNRGDLGREDKDFALIFDADNAIIKVKAEKSKIAKGSKAAGTLTGGDIKGNILCGTRDEAGKITALGTVKKIAALGGNLENGKVVAEKVGKVTVKPKAGKGGKVIDFTTETE